MHNLWDLGLLLVQLHFFINIEKSSSLNLKLSFNIFISLFLFLAKSIGNFSHLHMEHEFGFPFLLLCEIILSIKSCFIFYLLIKKNYIYFSKSF